MRAGAAAIIVGQAILPAAAFQAAPSGYEQSFASGKGRLKAGCSQDWLPHSTGTGMLGRQAGRPVLP
jgi:hypothetical protein